MIPHWQRVHAEFTLPVSLLQPTASHRLRVGTLPTPLQRLQLTYSGDRSRFLSLRLLKEAPCLDDECFEDEPLLVERRTSPCVVRNDVLPESQPILVMAGEVLNQFCV